MKLTCIKDSRWQRKDGSILSVVKGQDVEVGVDVSDAIAEDMIRCDYAVAKKGMPRVETKEVERPDKTVEIPVVDFDIYSTNDKDVLEKYARDTYGVELDKRKSAKSLRKQIEKAKENNNE